jgi:hypothetical protein
MLFVFSTILLTVTWVAGYILTERACKYRSAVVQMLISTLFAVLSLLAIVILDEAIPPRNPDGFETPSKHILSHNLNKPQEQLAIH